MTRLPLLAATLLLAAVLAGCNDSPPSDGTSSSTSTGPAPPALEWVYVNRTLTITGERPPNNAQVGFVASPDNANCLRFEHIGKAGLAAIEATADGENPDTVASWEFEALFTDAGHYMAPNVKGALPLMLNVTGLDVEGQSSVYIDLRPAQAQPGLAVRSTATLAIRLAVLAPADLYVPDRTISCT